MDNKYKNVIYRPVYFIIGTFIITWCCAWLMPKVDYNSHTVLFTLLDFIENASPLLCAIILLRKNVTGDKFFQHFLLGETDNKLSYVIVLLLFAGQFWNFYLFQVENADFSLPTFITVFVGQLLLGGGLEEAGWRGYLLPCLYKKYDILLSSLVVSIIWVIWHLPYFFISDSMQAGESLISYSFIGIITGFILAAIYLLTKSVLLCTLFHSWQNTIVMTVEANMENVWFIIVFISLGVVSVLLCLNKQKQDRIVYNVAAEK